MRYLLLAVSLGFLLGCQTTKGLPSVDRSRNEPDSVSSCLNRGTLLVKKRVQKLPDLDIVITTLYGYHGLKVFELIQAPDGTTLKLWMEGEHFAPTHVYSSFVEFKRDWPMPITDLVCYANIREA